MLLTKNFWIKIFWLIFFTYDFLDLYKAHIDLNITLSLIEVWHWRPKSCFWFYLKHFGVYLVHKWRHQGGWGEYQKIKWSQGGWGCLKWSKKDGVIYIQPRMKDALWWKTTFNSRLPLMEDALWWKTTLDWRQPLRQAGTGLCQAREGMTITRLIALGSEPILFVCCCCYIYDKMQLFRKDNDSC